MLIVRAIMGAGLAAAASVGSWTAVGAEPGVIMLAAAAIAGANLVESMRLLRAWGGDLRSVFAGTGLAVAVLNWLSVDVLLLALGLMLAGALAWFRWKLERE